MKTIIVATPPAVWLALILAAAPGQAIAAPAQCDAFGVAPDSDCSDMNPGGPMQSARPPSNPGGPTHVHCDCVKLVDDHSEPCCP